MGGRDKAGLITCSQVIEKVHWVLQVRYMVGVEQLLGMVWHLPRCAWAGGCQLRGESWYCHLQACLICCSAIFSRESGTIMSGRLPF